MKHLYRFIFVIIYIIFVYIFFKELIGILEFIIKTLWHLNPKEALFSMTHRGSYGTWEKRDYICLNYWGNASYSTKDQYNNIFDWWWNGKNW